MWTGGRGAGKPEALGSHPNNSGEGAREEFKGRELFGQMEKGGTSAPNPQKVRRNAGSSDLEVGGRGA